MDNFGSVYGMDNGTRKPYKMSLPIYSPMQLKAVQTHGGALYHCLVTYNHSKDYIVDYLFQWVGFTEGQPYWWHFHGMGFKIHCRQGFIEYKHDDYSTSARRVIVGFRKT